MAESWRRLLWVSDRPGATALWKSRAPRAAVALAAAVLKEVRIQGAAHSVAVKGTENFIISPLKSVGSRMQDVFLGIK